jgi:ATP-dependent Lon protease
MDQKMIIQTAPNKTIKQTSSKKTKKTKKELACKAGGNSDSDSEYIPGIDSSMDSDDEREEYSKFIDMLKGKTVDDSDASDSDASDSDDDELDSDEEEELAKKMNFNIVFTVGGNRYQESEDDTESEDDEDEDEDSDEEEDENVIVVDTESKKTSTGITTRSKEKSKHSEDLIKSSTKLSKKSTKSAKAVSQTSKKAESTSDIPSYSSSKMEELMKILDTSTTPRDDVHKEVLSSFESMLTEKRKAEDAKRKKMETKKKAANTKKMKKLLREKNVFNEYKYFKQMDLASQQKILDELETITKETSIDIPYKIQIIQSSLPPQYKATALKKIDSLMYMDPGSGEYYKVKQWVDTFMKIPFGKFSHLPVNMDSPTEDINTFMEDAKKTLDDCVYGLDDAKMQIMQMMGQWISNPDAVGTAIAIKGPMGTGKTTLVKEGISKILNRPFAFIALGGATDSAFLEGHSYTYEGSIWGKIVDILIQSKSMNPVIYFDELDKVSDTAKGEEIIGILTHLTDTTQNSQFHDKYFSNVDFDLSKALFIFSYNDERKVNPILRDRMYRIQTEGYKNKDKFTIASKYLIPRIEATMNFRDTIKMDSKVIEYICNEYTDKEAGVRNLKRCIEIIYSKLNLYRLMKPDTSLFKDEDKVYEIGDEFEVTVDVVKNLIKKTEDEASTFYRNMYL